VKEATSVEILVLGCGVSGLTTGISLQRAGHAVRIWAQALPPATTSNIAAAVWYPYRAYPIDRVTRWGAVAYRAFQELASVEGSGVIDREVIELLGAAGAEPWWNAGVDGFRRAEPSELPADYADGFVFRAPVIDMSVYLEFLMGAFLAGGGQIEQREVSDLAEAFAVSRVVVNCAGLGSRALVGDTDVHAARGQVLRIAPNGFERVLLDDTGPNKVAYIVPRLHDIILGGVDDDHDERLEVDEDQTPSILARCANLVEHYDPRFAASLRAHHGQPSDVAPAEILGIAVGLRPVRSSVRVEAERVAPDRLLLHNSGHGGAGVTLSWGCAADVVALLEAAGLK
jgi:D-amino-acid oxidase